MANVKYESYTFADEAEMYTVIEGEGYLINATEEGVSGELQSNNIITDTAAGEGDATYLDMHWLGQIPLDQEEPPTMSVEVYCTSARNGNFKIPSNYKTQGQMTKYVDSLNRYGGAPSLEDEEVVSQAVLTEVTTTYTKTLILQWMDDQDIPTELYSESMTKAQLVLVILAWFW